MSIEPLSALRSLINTSDREEAPLMVLQRGLFAFVPGVRSEAARTAASTPALPRECAVYLVQGAAPHTSASSRSPHAYGTQRTQHCPAPAHQPMGISAQHPPPVSFHSPVCKPPDAARHACATPARPSSSDPVTSKVPRARADPSNVREDSQQPQRLIQAFTTRAATCTGAAMQLRRPRNLERATFAQAPAPLPRRHARQQRRENNQEQPHQVASSADPTASAPQLRGGSHVAIEF
ncbi:hypothetical protein EDB85DRAFT_2158630 [Lactarius pseudohatsudake]|nr:hypothetical protein EDB85DRAFT_2158630 [Lactarius pseudohatsudake]